MSELSEILNVQALFLILVLLLAIRGFTKTVAKGQIELWHFYATKTGDGQHYGDANKLGIMVGIFASTLFVGYMFWSHDVDNWPVVAVFGLWLTFIAGCEYFSKVARTIAAKIAKDRIGTFNPDQTITPKP